MPANRRWDLIQAFKGKNKLRINGRIILSFSGAFAKLRKAILASSCTSACLSIRMEKLGSHRTDFHEILYLNIFRKSAGKIEVSLKLDQNNGYLTRRYTFMKMSHWIRHRMRNIVEKIKARILSSTIFLQTRAVYEMWKNTEQRGYDRRQNGACALHVGYLGLQTHTHTHTHRICKTFQINQPTRCNNFSSLLLDVYVQLNMFRASSRPSSGAQQLQ